jgi:hypothetical protein
MDFLSNARVAFSPMQRVIKGQTSPEIGNKCRFLPHQRGAADKLTRTI